MDFEIRKECPTNSVRMWECGQGHRDRNSYGRTRDRRFTYSRSVPLVVGVPAAGMALIFGFEGWFLCQHGANP